MPIIIGVTFRAFKDILRRHSKHVSVQNINSKHILNVDGNIVYDIRIGLCEKQMHFYVFNWLYAREVLLVLHRPLPVE